MLNEKLEYLVILLSKDILDIDAEYLMDELDEYGEDCWELVIISGDKAIFKRKLNR